MDNEYKLEWFEILTYYKKRYVIYGAGAWHDHVKDWNGCNFFHGRISCPIFNSVEDASEWLKEQVKKEKLKEGTLLKGHHAGVYGCSHGCDEREVKTTYFYELMGSK